jgi:hypothetical protein
MQYVANYQNVNFEIIRIDSVSFRTHMKDNPRMRFQDFEADRGSSRRRAVSELWLSCAKDSLAELKSAKKCAGRRFGL